MSTFVDMVESIIGQGLRGVIAKPLIFNEL
jgi:hypothetical protein